MNFPLLCLVFRANLLSERYTAYDNTCMVVLAKTIYRYNRYCVCCSALRFLSRKSLAETNPMDGYVPL